MFLLHTEAIVFFPYSFMLNHFNKFKINKGVAVLSKGLECSIQPLFLLCPDGGASESERWRLRVQHVFVHAAALPRFHAGGHVQRRPPHCQGCTWELLYWPRWPAVSVSVMSKSTPVSRVLITYSCSTLYCIQFALFHWPPIEIHTNPTKKWFAVPTQTNV